MGRIVRRECGGRSRSHTRDQANPNFETLLMTQRDVHNNVDIQLLFKKVEEPFELGLAGKPRQAGPIEA
jgi:hypothetical protein